MKMTEKEAKERFGAYQVAALGALVKSVGEDGTVVPRVLFDGTHGVRINKDIRVRDQDRGPAAPDLRRFLRELARVGGPFFALTADVKDAHILVPHDPRDWGLLGCRVRGGRGAPLLPQGGHFRRRLHQLLVE